MKKRYIAAGLAAAALCTGAFAAAQAGYITIGRTLSSGEVDAMVQQSVQTAVQDIETRHLTEQQEKDRQIEELTRQLESLEIHNNPEKNDIAVLSESEPVDEAASSVAVLPVSQPLDADSRDEKEVDYTAEISPEKTNIPTAVINEGTVFEGYVVTVNDWTTPATFAGGKDWPITVWYFYDEEGSILGSISGEAAMSITQRHSSGHTEWEFWFAEAFNEYRQLEHGSDTDPVPSQKFSNSSGDRRAPDFDAEEYALNAFDLINDARSENGLHIVEMDDYAMELARMRVQELEENYSHNRSGGRMSQEYGCGEIINRRANTPEVAVSSWLDSHGHYEIIMADRYHSAGIACFKGNDGVVYWCMLFFR